MPPVKDLRRRLSDKLLELFQLDQPDLDFGFYRIMHAKAQEVQDFINKDLLKIVEDAFGEVDEARKAELKAKIDQEIEAAREHGVAEPENSPKVKEARASYDALKDSASAEADVYDHLYRFFERYYDNGDFISRRYYTRETPGKAAPFAVPYNGEEVKLHWANADQYYIKSAEYFSNFTFDLTQTAEIKQMSKEEQQLKQIPNHPMRVHFKVVAATEGEHGNVKATDANNRFFILHAENPVALTETGELVVNFEYRPDPEKTGQDGTWRDKRNAEAVETMLEALKNHKCTQINSDQNQEKTIAVHSSESVVQNYLRLLETPAPTEKDPKRPILAKYVNQYTARNTVDYFIHKDLGSFLRRELDFYIKNEVMRLDDIENADAPAVESYLAKIKVLRKIAGKLIDFLAQLEDFQKKLWLKKKFVVETHYCVTLDRVPEELYEEIAACDAQLEEWVKLGFVKNKELEPQIDPDAHRSKDKEPGLFSKNTGANPSESVVQRLKANNKLLLDTRFFDDSFKARLVAAIKNFDEQCDGLLIHSENFQALNLLQERYREQVKCVYIDPPYNTDASPIIYKNSYRNSSWLSLIEGRLILTKPLCHEDGIVCVTIDDFERKELESLMESTWGRKNILGIVAIRNNPSGRPTPLGFAISHEYAIFASKMIGAPVSKLPRSQSLNKRYKEKDDNGKFMWELLRKRGSDSERKDNPKAFFPFYVAQEGRIRLPDMNWCDDQKTWIITDKPNSDEIVAYPIDDNGIERRWRWGIDKAKNEVSDLKASISTEGNITIYYKYRPPTGVTATTNWIDSKYSSTEHGTGLLKRFFDDYDPFSFPKSIFAVQDCLLLSGIQEKNTVLDYFAGSGTTGHAVINLNREDNGKRKYILVEMGDYFDTVLKPRIAKVVYSESWKDGKPVPAKGNHGSTQIDSDNAEENPCSSVSICGSSFNGISHCFKYIRLESYEDTLNNLRFDEKPGKSQLLKNQSLKEDYMLRYMLDVETRSSQSLLNINAFADPTGYTLDVKKPGTDEYATRAVDLLETFNYLIGLRVEHYAAPQEFTAKFKRIKDPEVPKDPKTKLVLDGKLQQIKNHGFTQIDSDKIKSNPCSSESICGSKTWWFRKIEGWVPADPANPNNGQQEKVLIVWRKLTDDIEQDNLMLDEWFQKNRISARDFEFDTIYVNGSNNLPNLKKERENWKVRLIEEEFMKRMWEGQ